jgi:tRNA pseudouridine13 synthase
MVISPQLDLTLPYITSDLPGIGGVIRERPELFRVVEVPAYEPLGYGDHIYINITKQEKTTRDTQIELSKLFGLRREDVGHAGLKDKYAVSTQTFSLLIPGEETKEVATLVESSLGLTVNWARRHPKKLRSGHLKGNTFAITITDLDTPKAEALKIVEKINEVVSREGIPNYFGSQRIGIDGRNVVDGLNLITDRYREHNRWLRRFLVSSYLSYLCNRYLSERVSRSLFTILLRGDLAKKHDTGGVFTVEDPAAEQTRFDAGEISFTAPIFGYKMRESKYEAREFEDEIFAGGMVNLDQLRRLGADGTRRLGRILPFITIKPHPEGITLSFTLPAGGYATVVLREFMKKEEMNKPVDVEVEEIDDIAYEG